MFIICHYLDDVSKISKAGKILKEKKRLLKNPRYRKIKQRITDMERLKFFRWFMRKARGGGGRKFRFYTCPISLSTHTVNRHNVSNINLSLALKTPRMFLISYSSYSAMTINTRLATSSSEPLGFYHF